MSAPPTETVLASGYRLACFEDIDSTNSEVLRRARAGTPEKLWIMAVHQHAGRGRQGRIWVSDRGNLFASVLLRPHCTPAAAASLSFVAALALLEAVAASAPEIAPALRLKWPNDLLCNGAKLAGILLESEAGHDGRPAIAIGMGANCAHHPADTLYRVTNLAAEGQTVTARQLFAALHPAFARFHAQWDDGKGFAAIRRLWLVHAAGLGERITVTSRNSSLSGIFEDLDETGALLLRTASGIRKIAAGDVSLGALSDRVDSPDR